MALTSTTAATSTFTASVGGTTIATQSVTFVPGPVDVDGANTTTITSSGGVKLADGTAAHTVTVTARDAKGNLIPNAPVVITLPAELTATGGTVSGNTVTGVTDQDGVFRVTVTSATAGLFDVTATAGGAAIKTGSPASVQFVPVPTKPVVEPTNGTIVKGTALANTTVSVKDKNGVVLCTSPVDAAGNFSCVPAPTPANLDVLTVSSVDQYGHSSPNATVIVDAEPPALPTVKPTNGSVVTGTAEPLSRVDVKAADGTILCTTTATPEGTYSCVPSPRPAHDDLLTVVSTDAAGNSASVEVRVKNVAPATPVLEVSDGKSVRGVATPGTTVFIYNEAGLLLGSSKVDESGTFTVQFSTPQADGVKLYAISEDETGNRSGEGPGVVKQPAPYPVLCTTLPDLRITCSGTAPVGATATVTDANGAVVCSTTVTAADGSWSCTSTGPVTAAPLSVTITEQDGTATVTQPVYPTPTAITDTVCVELADKRVKCSGTGTPGYTVVVTDANGAVVCSSTIAQDGSWSCTSTGPVTARPLNVTITSPDGISVTTKNVPVTKLAVTGSDLIGQLSIMSTLITLLGVAVLSRRRALGANR